MRLTAPLAVRGGKNSRENQRSPDSILLRILSRNLSERSPSSTGVEHLELSLELSPLLLLAPLESGLLACQPLSTLWSWFTMMATYTEERNTPMFQESPHSSLLNPNYPHVPLLDTVCFVRPSIQV